MRIAVTGTQGQVVSCLIEAACKLPGIEIVPLGRPELDLAVPSTITPALAAAQPHLVVSAAAYTAVDLAEDEPELAYRVNATGAGTTACAAEELGVPIIHLSTDYVFSGHQQAPYVEEDPTGPISVYGASKLAGERAVAAANPRHLIMRTAWVYSAYGKNFVKTMVRLAQDRNELSVVRDQWGNPTSAHDIADCILHIALRLRSDSNFTGWGVYHLAGQGETNWSGFASHVLHASKRLSGPYAHVREIAAADYPTRARRPANSRLRTQKLLTEFGWSSPPWQEAADAVVASIVPHMGKTGR